MPAAGPDFFPLLARTRLVIAGLGLMGGSLALALRDRCQAIYAVDPDPAALALARETRVAHRVSADPAELLPLADLLVLAAPVREILRLLAALPDLHPGRAVVLDLGSTKGEIARALAALPPRFDPIGGHPMCGRETSGLRNADPALYHGAPFALIPLPQTSAHARALAGELVAAVGARPLWLDPQTHDAWVAATSHLPYLLAAALALATPAEAAPLAGPGFRSTVRLAGSDPRVIHDILMTNRAPVDAALARFRQALDALEMALGAPDPGLLLAALHQARDKRASIMADTPLVFSPSAPLRGSLALPGDKSLSHRAALCAALAEGESRIENFLVAGVTRVMLEALTTLGVDLCLEGTTLTVYGRGLAGLRPPAAPLDCGNSATTMRLLAGLIAAAGIPAVLDGSAGLRRRPMNRIIEPLREMGVELDAASEGCAPLAVWARGARLPLSSGSGPRSIAIPVASAQVKTCLLLAALAASAPVTVVEPGPSRDHTERMLASMGVDIARREQPDESRPPASVPRFATTLVPPLAPLAPLRLALPGDFSSAAFMIAAALVTPGSEITLREVGLNPTRTGLLDVLAAMGAQIQLAHERTLHNEPVGDLTVRYGPLTGTEVGGSLVVRMIDEFPAFAVVAAYAHGPTTVRDATELRHKESDRITALCAQLRAVGVEIHETPDGFTLPGSTPPAGGDVFPQGDHRLAMALAVAALGARGPVVIHHPAIIHESFPEFVPALAALGAHIR